MKRTTDVAPGAAAEPATATRGGGSASGFLRSLVAEKRLTAAQAQEVRALKLGSKGSLVQCIAKLGYLKEPELVALLARHAGVEVIDLAKEKPDPDLVSLLPYKIAHQRGVLPICIEEGRAIVAMSDPTDIVTRDELASFLGTTVDPVLAAPSAIERAIANVYRPADTAVFELLEKYEGATDGAGVEVVADPSASAAEPGLEGEAAATEADEAAALAAAADAAVASSPIVKLVDLILRDAVTRRASDIHLEPHEGEILVRFRIDGALRDVQTLPRSVRLPVTSRIKILCGMNITVTRRPQDARAKLRVDGRDIDLRVSTLPTIYGEKFCIRILDPKNLVLDLTRLFAAPELEQFESLLLRPQGMVLVTGPTGSGKTTTLYSALHRLEERTTNIVTLEDPVEYKLAGINQVEINEKVGLAFPIALRAMLRQDPNVVLVGEIRDAETARVAVQAAVTGHLLLSTLHTNDATSAVARLIDLGVDATLLAEALNGIVAQRLFRRLCPHCREAYTATAEEVEGVAASLRGATLYRPKGCEACDYVGYRGRAAAYEILPILPSLKGLINVRGSEQAIRTACRAAGIPSMFDAGIRHALAGTTTLAEVVRVVPRDPLEPELRCSGCGDGLEKKWKSCPKCGTRVSSVCAECRQEVRAGWSFCAECGKAVPGPKSEKVVAADAAAAKQSALAYERSGTRRVADIEAAPAKPAAVEKASNGLEVIVADDAPDLRRMYTRWLEAAGYRVREAANGEDALREIAARRPDALVTDIHMPGLDGIEVCHRLRQRLDTAALPILLLTASEVSEEDARQAGADDYLRKPVMMPVLVRHLALALESKAGAAKGPSTAA